MRGWNQRYNKLTALQMRTKTSWISCTVVLQVSKARMKIFMWTEGTSGPCTESGSHPTAEPRHLLELGGKDSPVVSESGREVDYRQEEEETQQEVNQQLLTLLNEL